MRSGRGCAPKSLAGVAKFCEHRPDEEVQRPTHQQAGDGANRFVDREPQHDQHDRDVKQPLFDESLPGDWS